LLHFSILFLGLLFGGGSLLNTGLLNDFRLRHRNLLCSGKRFANELRHHFLNFFIRLVFQLVSLASASAEMSHIEYKYEAVRKLHPW
jgi:hypothetical protein